MKRLIFAIFLLLPFKVYGQQKTGNGALDSLRQEKDTTALQNKIKQLKAGSEKDLIVLFNYFSNDQTQRDSVLQTIYRRYPKSDFVFTQKERDLWKEDDADRKEQLFFALKKTFPERNYESIYSTLSQAFAQSKDVAKMNAYLEKITSAESRKTTAALDAQEVIRYNAPAVEKLLKPEAEHLIASVPPADPRAKGWYYGIANLYGTALLKQGRYQQALVYIKMTYDNITRRDDQLNTSYGLVMAKTGNYKEALPVLEKLVDDGKADDELKKAFAESYENINPGKKASDYLRATEQALKAKIASAVAAKMISEPAPDFKLTDTNGKPVSLANFKGKIVVLDFWATWCAPCKASFPTMQRIVNRYKADPGVVFLFIHTMETSKTPLADAKKYLTANHYSFKLYMDLKDPRTKKNKAVAAFHPDGIPAKYIIDGNGNTRFKVVGFSGREEETIAEVSDMIDMVKKKINR